MGATSLSIENKIHRLKSVLLKESHACWQCSLVNRHEGLQLLSMTHKGAIRPAPIAKGRPNLRPRKKGENVSMPLIQLVMVLIVVGVLLWLINRFIPMKGTIKSILNAVVVIVVVLWLLNVFGLFHSFSNIRVGS